MLTLKGEGDIWLTVLSNNSVFVQSHLLETQFYQSINDSLLSYTSNTDDEIEPHECYKYATVKVFVNLDYYYFILYYLYYLFKEFVLFF